MFLAVLLFAAAQSQPPPAPSHPAVTIEQVNRWETELSNWGRWGKDDERGALNLVTPQKQVEAARLVKDGVTISLAHFADLEKAVDNFNFGPTKHEMFHNRPPARSAARWTSSVTGFTTAPIRI